MTSPLRKNRGWQIRRGRLRALGKQVSGFFYVLDDVARILFVDDDPILREFA